MRLRLTRTAAKQITQALDYIAERSPQGAESVRERIRIVIDVLRNFPQLGQETDRAGYRRVVLLPYPYALVYRVTDREIVVMRLRHTARRPL